MSESQARGLLPDGAADVLVGVTGELVAPVRQRNPPPYCRALTSSATVAQTRRCFKCPHTTVPVRRWLKKSRRQPRPAPCVPVPTAESRAALKILILEDVPTDAELMQRALRKAGLDFTARRVDNRAGFIEALETFAPDIVLSDYRLPDFNGAEALAHVRHVHPEIPVVIVTGALGEEGAVELLKAGAADYVLKSNLLRLSLFGRAGIWESNKAFVPARLPKRHCAPPTPCCRRPSGSPISAASTGISPAAGSSGRKKPTGCSGFPPTNLCRPWPGFAECVHPDDRARVQQAIDASVTRNQPFDAEFRILRPDKAERIIHSRGEVIRDENGLPIRVTGTSHDITERKEAERTLRRLNRTLRTLSRGNEALVRAASEPELLTEMCRVIVETGGYRMAWVGVPQQDAAKTVTPVAWAGIGANAEFSRPVYPAPHPAGRAERSRDGWASAGRALNSGQSQTSQDLLKDPAMTLWRARFARYGISATAAFPLRNSTGGSLRSSRSTPPRRTPSIPTS